MGKRGAVAGHLSAEAQPGNVQAQPAQPGAGDQHPGRLRALRPPAGLGTTWKALHSPSLALPTAQGKACTPTSHAHALLKISITCQAPMTRHAHSDNMHTLSKKSSSHAQSPRQGMHTQ